MTTAEPVMRKTLILSDNLVIARAIRNLVESRNLQRIVYQAHSPSAPASLASQPWSNALDLKTITRDFFRSYGLLISAHSKQIFPKFLVEELECINIHPGYNPETRGWFPQVWAILFGRRLGFTIHKMDSELDHGPIIDRMEVPVYLWDTSKSAYDRVLEQEIRWIEENFTTLMAGKYSYFAPEGEGDLFLKKDFSALCEFNVDEELTFLEFYNRLRALSYEGYSNAFFRDPRTGRKIFLQLSIQHEGDLDDWKERN